MPCATPASAAPHRPGPSEETPGIPRILHEGLATLSYSLDDDLTLNAFAVTTSTRP